MVDYIPGRGDFIRIDFVGVASLKENPQSGHEQMGNRPALVVSQSGFNQYRGFALVCPISNTKRRNPWNVTIPNDLSVTGVIMTDQLRSLDYRSRMAVSLGTCPEDLLTEVLNRIYPILF
jgi:mRNA interferase MazF